MTPVLTGPPEPGPGTNLPDQTLQGRALHSSQPVGPVTALLSVPVLPLVAGRLPCPSSRATGEARTPWPCSKGPSPPVSGRNQTPPWHTPPGGSLPSLSTLALGPGQWPRQAPLPFRTRCRLPRPSVCQDPLCLGPATGSLPAEPRAPRLAGSPSSGAQGLPSPCLSAQCSWHRWGLTFCGV